MNCRKNNMEEKQDRDKPTNRVLKTRGKKIGCNDKPMPNGKNSSEHSITPPQN